MSFIKHILRRYKTLFKGWNWKLGLFVSFGQLLCSWIRIRIPNTDPDPVPGIWKAKSMRIHPDPNPEHCKDGLNFQFHVKIRNCIHYDISF